MSDVILDCQGVSIRYMTGDFKSIGLKEWVVRRLTARYKVTEFWADRDVSFSLNKGDMLGIIGSNGAGKSTLLKVVSGIMEPTVGKMERKGSVAALLELASGFDGDLTVKENAYLRGAMLGYTRAFMEERYSDILDFAELRSFEDRPFKQLSSGMKSRLAFSIAAQLNPEILILDEVLAVGDGAFRVKSEAKMREIISGGATTILVSHSLAQVRSMCNKILWLHKGRQIVFTDDVEGACDCYAEFLKNGGEPVYDPVASRARIEARHAETVKQEAAYEKMQVDAAAFSRLYTELHGHLLRDFGLVGRAGDEFDNKTHFRYMRPTLENESPMPLMMQILRERHMNWVVGEELKRKVAHLESELSRKDVEAVTFSGQLASERERLKSVREKLDAVRPEVEGARFMRSELTSAQTRTRELGQSSHHAASDDLAYLHARLLEVLSAVADLCDHHGLRYFMIAGTLLGAVRHRGFIPWDDDVDIAMPREDFESFLKLAGELPEGFFLQPPDTGCYPLYIAMVRRNGTFVDELLRNFPVHHGIGIDIFPLDRCPRGDCAARVFFKVVESSTSALAYKGDDSLVMGPKGFFGQLVFKGMCLLPVWMLRALRRGARGVVSVLSDGSRLCTPTGRHRYPAEAYPAEWFDSSVPREFEGRMFQAPVGWQALMSHMYGDWERPVREEG